MAVVAPLELLPEVEAFLRVARVGHMATADDAGVPAVVPICFVLQKQVLYTLVDDKPKNVEPLRLQRVQNLQANPHLSVVVDRWDEDWSRLGWVLLRGTGQLLPPVSSEQRLAVDLLREKYTQYRSMNLREAPGIKMTLLGARHWGDISV